MSTLNGPNVVGSWDASKFIAENDVAAARGLARATQIFIRQLKINLSVPGPTKSHPENRASLPGEAPHRRTGALRASQKGVPVDSSRLVWRAGSHSPEVKYALWLELGLPSPGAKGLPRLEARPHLRPTLRQVQPEMVAAVIEEVRIG